MNTNKDEMLMMTTRSSYDDRRDLALSCELLNLLNLNMEMLKRLKLKNFSKVLADERKEILVLFKLENNVYLCCCFWCLRDN